MRQKIFLQSLAYLADSQMVIKRGGIAGNIFGLASVVRQKEKYDAPWGKLCSLHNGRGYFYAVFIVKNGKIFYPLAIEKISEHIFSASKNETLPIIIFIYYNIYFGELQVFA